MTRDEAAARVEACQRRNGGGSVDAYARLLLRVRRDALEECAAICDETAEVAAGYHDTDEHPDVWMAQSLAKRIRALIDEGGER